MSPVIRIKTQRILLSRVTPKRLCWRHIRIKSGGLFGIEYRSRRKDLKWRAWGRGVDDRLKCQWRLTERQAFRDLKKLVRVLNFLLGDHRPDWRPEQTIAEDHHAI